MAVAVIGDFYGEFTPGTIIVDQVARGLFPRTRRYPAHRAHPVSEMIIHHAK